jgi:hypothetical protein
MWARSLKEITASDSTINHRAAKRLGPSKRQIRKFASLFKRLGGRFAPKNRLFSSRVEKAGLRPISGGNGPGVVGRKLYPSR